MSADKSAFTWVGMRVHQARIVKDWLAEHRPEIEVFHLPAYSLEFSPDEGINSDLKQAATRKPPTRTPQELKRNVINHMRKLSKSPKSVRRFFLHPTFRYAA